MPTIRNFPAELLNEHARWHHANHHDNLSDLPPGYGEQFLRFHRDYIGRALQWYYQSGQDPRLVRSWIEVPEAIRNTRCYNREAEMRIRNAPQSFATADELGRFIEATNLHGCIHQEAARIYGEPDLNDFDLAPRCTVFYNIHGMIDNWYRQWEQVMGYRTENPFVFGAGPGPATGTKKVRSQAADLGSKRRIFGADPRESKLDQPVKRSLFRSAVRAKGASQPLVYVPHAPGRKRSADEGVVRMLGARLPLKAHPAAAGRRPRNTKPGASQTRRR